MRERVEQATANPGEIRKVSKPGKCWDEARMLEGGFRFALAHCHLSYGHVGDHEYKVDPPRG